MKLKTLLKKAATDPKALAELRQRFSSGVTVFVPGADGIDIDATCAAVDYYEQHGHSPLEWGEDDDGQDILTVDIAEAFPERRRLNPLTMQPITPGLWSRLWDSKNGHERVAALWWGQRTGAIRDSDTQIKLNIRMLLTNGGWPLLRQCIIDMSRDAEVKRRAMDVVYPAAQSPRPAPRQTSEQKGAQAASSDLDAAYNRGEIDIARYPKLKASQGDGDLSSYIIQPLYDPPHYRNHSALHKALVESFNLAELEDLAFDLNCNPEKSLRSRDTTSSLARELLTWALRHGRGVEFLVAMRRANPASWGRYLSG